LDKFENDNLESFLREKEKILKENEKYSRFLFAPIIVIIVSLLVITYNFTVGRDPDFLKLAENQIDRAVADAAEEPHKLVIENENDGKINLNTATKEELDSLPGIGEAKAEAIIKLREKMDGFKEIEDILNADGIGEKIFQKIKDMIFIN
jgi:comEA protein